MHKKVVSSLTILLLGLSTTAYAGGYYHGDHYYQGNINGNHARVRAITENIAHYDIKFNEISTTAVGAYTGLESEGSHNYFFTINGNKGPVRAKTLTESQDDIVGNKISTTAIGAQTYLKSTGHGNHSFALNFNKDYVGAVTNTWARDQIDDNTITTTAIGASLSVDNTKEGGHHFRGRYYSSPNFFGSLNLNRGNVSAQTNTVGSAVNGNTINTTAVGAATSITTHIGGH